jgi:hypothetical protein
MGGQAADRSRKAPQALFGPPRCPTTAPQAGFSAADGVSNGNGTGAVLALLEYPRRLHQAGCLALHWPRKWGGAGAGPVEQAIYQDEVLRLGLPAYGANQLAIDRIGPTVMLFGSDAQKKRFLPAMLTAKEIWMNQAYATRDPKRGRRLLDHLAYKLESAHPGAAASLREGVEETLTVMALRLSEGLNGCSLQPT